MFLLQVIQALDKKKIPYALVGGYAVSLHGAVRGTLDIDIIIPRKLECYCLVEKALATLSLSSRLPVTAEEVFNFREEYIANRNLRAWSFLNPADLSQVVDIVITHDLEEMNTVRKKVKNTSVKLVAIEDLIEMKRLAGRPQDLADIAALEQLR